MKRFISLFIMLNILCLSIAGAQETIRLVSGEGSGFFLIRDSVKKSYSLSSLDRDSFIIKEGDRILTEEGTFLELLSMSGRMRVMVGEESYLSVDTLDAVQGSLFTLSYGHLHGLLEAGESDLWISGRDTVCRVSQGEFGFILDHNLTLDQSEVNTRVYVLDGSVEVRQKKEDPSQDKRVVYKTPLTLNAGEMVVTSSWERDAPLVSTFFDIDYAKYWKQHPFSHIKSADFASVPSESEEEPALLQKPLITKITDGPVAKEGKFPINENAQLLFEQEKYKDITDMGTAALVMGTVFMTGAFASYMLGEGTLGSGLIFMGGFNLIAGAGAMGYTYFYQPPVPE